MSALDKNEAQQPIKDSDDVTANYRFVLITPSADGTIPYGDLSGSAPNKGLLYKIYTDLQATYTDVTIVTDSVEYVNLGAKATYRYIRIAYTATRDTLTRGGIIEVLNDGTDSIVNDAYLNSDDTNYDWLICEGVTGLGTQIQIKLTADDTDSNETTFKYRIIERILI